MTGFVFDWLLRILVLGVACLGLALAPQRLVYDDRRAALRHGAAAAGRALVGGTAAMALVAATSPGASGGVILSAGVLVSILVACAEFDIRWMMAPDLHWLAIAALAVWSPLALSWPEAVAGAVVGGGLLLAVRAWWLWRAKVEAIGLGDVKLLLALGALLGPLKVLWLIAAAALLGLAVAGVLRRGRGDMIPLAAAAAAPAAVIAWLGLP